MGSINQAQAAALADGFLESLGSGKDGLQLRNTFTEVELLAGECVEDMQTNLNRSGSISSGKLSESLTLSEPVANGNVLSVDISMNFYGLFVNSGVRGTKSGSGPYSFKNDRPGSKMVEAIRDWQKRGKAITKNIKPAKSTFRHERKGHSISQIDSAYAIARSIKQKGIKATGFLDKAIETTRAKVSDRLGAAFRIDVINSLNGF